MAFEFKIVDGTICAHLSRDLKSEDLLSIVELVAKIEAEAPVSPNRIIDLSAVEEVDLDFAVMQSLAAIRRTAPLKNKVKSAIVAPLPVQYGFARMFQTLNDNPNIELKLFKVTDEAWEWLRSAPAR